MFTRIFSRGNKKSTKLLQVILLKPFQEYTAGTAISVRPGVMRNELYPKKIAVYATEYNVKQYCTSIANSPVTTMSSSSAAVNNGVNVIIKSIGINNN